MKNVLSLLKEIDITKVLAIYIANKPNSEKKQCFDRCISRYYYLIEEYLPKPQMKRIITNYSLKKGADGKYKYDFQCVIDTDIDSMVEWPVCWKAVLNGEIELLIPECILNKIDCTYLAVIILECIDQTDKEPFLLRENPNLFKRVKQHAVLIEDKNCLESLHKGIEKIIKYDITIDQIQNELFDLNQMKYALYNWGTILKYKGDYRDEFYNLSKNNPVSYFRAMEQQNILLEKYVKLDIDDYIKKGNRNSRIIIESYYRDNELPLVYIMNDNRTKKLLYEVDEQDMLCMGIRVLDENMSIKHVIAILMFYLEYPIRTKRVLLMENKKRFVDILAKRLCN